SVPRAARQPPGSAGGGGGEEGGDPGGGGQGDPLAGALGGRVVGGEQAADAVDVGQERFARGVDRPQLGGDPAPRGGQRVVVEEAAAQVPHPVPEPVDGQAGHLLGQGAVTVGLDAVAGDPAGGQDQLLAAGGLEPGGALAADGGHPVAVALDPDRRKAELPAHAEGLQPGP